MIADSEHAFWPRLQDKMNEILEQSGIRRRRDMDRDNIDSETRTAPPGGVNLPSSLVVGAVLYLITSGIGGVWWAATMQAKVDHSEIDRAREEQRLWDSINNYHLEINALRIDIARVQGEQASIIQSRRTTREKGE